MTTVRHCARTVPHGQDTRSPLCAEDVLLRAPSAADVHLPLASRVSDVLAKLLEAHIFRLRLGHVRRPLHQSRCTCRDAILDKVAPALGEAARSSNIGNRQLPMHDSKASAVRSVMAAARGVRSVNSREPRPPRVAPCEAHQMCGMFQLGAHTRPHADLSIASKVDEAISAVEH